MPASIRTVRRFLCEAAIVLLTAGLLLQPAWAQKSLMRADAPFLPDKATVRAAERYNRLGMIFEANRGQSSPDAKFLARGAGYDLRLTRSEAVLRFGKSKGKGLTQEEALVRMKVLDGNPDAQVAGERLLPGKSNYFVGKDAAKWVTNVAQFAKVRYRDMYPGVDLVYYGQQGELEYDFVVRPGVDPAVIRLDIEGASQLTIEHGDLQWNTSAGEVRFRRPSIYQEVNGARREIGGGYLLKSSHEVGFEIASYDLSRPLVIDPVLAYGTFLQGALGGWSVAVDALGNAFVTGLTNAVNGSTLHRIAYVTKVNADGTAVLYSTYLGGTVDEWLPSVALDAGGNAYVAGSTQSPDFPTVNPIQPTNHGSYDAFLTKINNQGNGLVYSTFLGGSSGDQVGGVAVDSTGHAYVTGSTSSADFPTAKALQPLLNGETDGFLAKVNAAGSALVYSTFLGGSNEDSANGIVADATGNAYVTGSTNSTDFPMLHALQATNHGDSDAFVAKINAGGTGLIYSTYLGGSSTDIGGAIALDPLRNVYVTGNTFSTDFPMANAAQATNGGVWDIYVAKINTAGTKLVYSTYLGGSYNDSANPAAGLMTRNIAVDSTGNAYVTGTTGSSNFPLVNPLQASEAGMDDAFVAKLAPAGSLVYSTYLGGVAEDYGAGIAVDSVGSAFVTGLTYSLKFPTTPAAVDLVYNTSFLIKIGSQTSVAVNPAAWAFNSQLIGTESLVRKVAYTNKGIAAVTFNKIYIAGANAGDFTETDNCGTSLAPGDKCTVSVTFAPTVKGIRKGALAFSDSDPGSPHGVALSGIGTFINEAPATLSFVAQPVGTSSAPQSTILTNTGSTAVSFYNVSITGANAGDFSLSNGCGKTLAGGTSCSISVIFTPTAVSPISVCRA